MKNAQIKQFSQRKCIRNTIEIIGVIGLWGLGMITAVPANWPLSALLGLAAFSSLLMGVYAWWAIVERRGGDSHYFVMASLTVALTITSLSFSALQMPNGRPFLLALLGVFVVSVVVFVVRRQRKSSG